MAGTNRPSNPNLPTLYVADQRPGEVPGADWTGGLNRGGGCNVGLGINTGDYDPKVSDWTGQDQAEQLRDPQLSQNIGQDPGPITADQDPDFNDTLGFVDGTTLEVAPDASATDGNVTVINKTGLTVPSGSRLWGPQTVVAGQGGRVTIIDPTGTDAESPARVGVSGTFLPGQQITVDYTVAGGPTRTVVYDVLTTQTEKQAAVGLAGEFTVDPDVQAVQLDQPVNHVALWSTAGMVTVTRAVVT